ncbi:Growth arrest and DNA damage-inducible protein GADD45 alpha [Lamellibrachia satsuma]|nr:Growth arrest and DNA damage-inducible protein GADD45 alpha [Lamellibrachia satsuma]
MTASNRVITQYTCMPYQMILSPNINMTFEDSDDTKTYKIDNKMDIGLMLRDCLEAAKKEDRVTCGLDNACELLETKADGVMLCILPVNDTNDVTLQIHSTLIEAFCWENDINLVKVDSTEKLVKLLGSAPATNDNDRPAVRPVAATTADFECVLVEYPVGTPTEPDEEIWPSEHCVVSSGFNLIGDEAEHLTGVMTVPTQTDDARPLLNTGSRWTNTAAFRWSTLPERWRSRRAYYRRLTGCSWTVVHDAHPGDGVSTPKHWHWRQTKTSHTSVELVESVTRERLQFRHMCVCNVDLVVCEQPAWFLT